MRALFGLPLVGSLRRIVALALTGLLLGAIARGFHDWETVFTPSLNTHRAATTDSLPPDAVLTPVSPTNESELRGALGSERWQVLGRYLRNATLDECLALLENPPPSFLSIWTGRRDFDQLVVVRLIALDPEAAIEGIHASPPARGVLGKALAIWAQADLAAALAAAKSSDRFTQRNFLAALAETHPEEVEALTGQFDLSIEDEVAVRNALVRGLWEVDRAKALEVTLALPNSGDRMRLFGEFLNEWAKEDANAAFEWMVAQGPANHFHNACQMVVGEMARVDPRGTLQKVQDAEGLWMKDMLSGIALGRWVEKDPEAARQWLEQQPHGPRREGLTAHIAPDMAQEGPDKLVAWLAESGAMASVDWANESSSLAKLVRGEIESWVRTDPQAARDALAALPWTEFTQQSTQSLVRRWAEVDPKSAVEFARSLPSTNAVGANIYFAFQSWTQTAPDEAARYALELSGANERNAAIRAITSNWIRQDLEAALSWITTLEGAEREQALVTGGHDMATVDPDLSASLVAQIESPSARRQILSTLTTSWSKLEPQRTLEWLTELPVDEGGPHITTTASRWAASAPEQASSWIQTLPLGAARDKAVEGLVSSLVNQRTDSGAALAWAQSISDVTLRTRWVDAVLENQRTDER